MPSSATDTASLITAFNALHDRYEALLEQWEALALQNVAWSVWLDPVGGSDTNSGLTPATAVATLAKAVSLTPRGSYVLVNLMRDYDMDSDVSTDGRQVIVRGVKGTGVSPTDTQQRIFTQTVAGGAARLLRTSDGGAWHMRALDITLATSAITSGPPALFVGRLKRVALTGVGIRYTDGLTTVSLIGSDGTVVLETDTVSALDDALAGHWIEGVAGGVNPNTLGKVLTNLATL